MMAMTMKLPRIDDREGERGEGKSPLTRGDEG